MSNSSYQQQGWQDGIDVDNDEYGQTISLSINKNIININHIIDNNNITDIKHTIDNKNINNQLPNPPKQFHLKDQPLNILTSTRHSLQPDMLFGWKPKLPSCPLPLKFPNPLIDKIITLINKDSLYRIVYKNKHFVSSIEVNQQYEYYWKYRTRYSLNMALIQEAKKQQQMESMNIGNTINNTMNNIMHNTINNTMNNTINNTMNNTMNNNNISNLNIHSNITITKQQNLSQNYQSLLYSNNYNFSKFQQTYNNFSSQASECEYEFSSDFQSGNLDLAVRIKHNEFDCFIRSDSNTKGHCNWYYFKMTNKDRIGEVKINICNMAKMKNLYNKGMKPYVLEVKNNAMRKKDEEMDKENNNNNNDDEVNNTNTTTFPQTQLSEQWSQHPCYNIQFVERICRYGTETKDSSFNSNTTSPLQTKPYIFLMVFHTHTLNYKNSSNKSLMNTRMKILF